MARCLWRSRRGLHRTLPSRRRARDNGTGQALLFYSTAVPLPQREELAERLAAWCPDPLGRVFFCNSGAEANENALHLARRFTGRQTIVTLRGGLAWPHGRDARLHRWGAL